MSTLMNPQAQETKLESFLSTIHELGPVFADRAAVHDVEGSFVAESYAELKKAGLFAAAVPAELGGGGLSHSEMCDVLRVLAHYCPGAALTLAMHQHLVAATIYKYLKGQPGEVLLRKVVDGTVLVSTGGRDWLESNGQMKRAEGGYLVSARKAFASGSEVGDIFVSSARYDDPEEGPLVLHFGVPATSEGVRIEDDWDVFGMRGTGSESIVMEDVFVPDSAIALKRKQGVWHPVWGVVLMVAMPLIMAVYVGVAEAAFEKAKGQALKKITLQKNDPSIPYLLGEMSNLMTTAQLAVKDMISLANNYDFEPTLENANATLIRKTIATNALMATGEKALELAGGIGFYRGFGLERLVRDMHAAQFHPLPEKQQQLFTGRVALGLEPV
jgi:acyl-CoA dehydrogenase